MNLTARRSGELAALPITAGWWPGIASVFADYYDLAHTPFRSLRVINQDLVAPVTVSRPMATGHGGDFTYVLEGVIEHRDSLGNHAQISPDRMRYITQRREA
jgi:redox-sensitive bicupin YhaK (pirin superfamily)